MVKIKRGFDMNIRENILSLYRRQGYEHAPVVISLCPSLQEKYKSVAGDVSYEEYFDYPEGFAIAGVPSLKIKEQNREWSEYYNETFQEGTVFDAYGVAHEPGGKAAMHMTRMHHPMANFTSLEEMQAFPFPVFDTENITHIREAVNYAKEKGKASKCSMQCTIWETAWYIRDMTQLMMDMVMEDEKATFILDKITEHACQRAVAVAKAGVDVIELGDDIGMQNAIMMSTDMYQMWLKPRLVKVISAAKKANPDVLIFYHTCGFVEPFIDDLIESGVDILNPVQPECMDFGEIYEKYGDRLSFNGTVGTQTTMPFGTPEEVRKVVFKNLEIAGDKGGLLCCPTHLLEPEVPWENIEAYVYACKEFKTAGG